MRGGSWDIYTMRADGAQVVKLTAAPDKHYYTSWSPDGKRIAFSGKQGDSKTDIYTIDVDGTHLVRLTTDAAADSTPAWSPP